MAEENKKARPKLNRKLLYWVLPGVFVPTVLILIFIKGTDLGQKDADRAAAEKLEKERIEKLSARVPDPEAAAQEAARSAQEAAARNRPLPPPPSAATDIEKRSAESHLQKLAAARESVGSLLSDTERQGVAPEANTRGTFVVFTSPVKEGLVSAPSADTLKIKAGEKKAEPPKPFLQNHTEEVKPEKLTTATRVDGKYWIASGTIIRAALINAVDTKIPGQITARVTEPVYDSRYGRYMVIPAGSTLIGAYDSAVAQNQTRILMQFGSLITPSGGVVNLAGTRATDALGNTGIEGELHTYFWKQLGVATLLALESVALDRLANSQTTVATNGSTSTTTNTSEAAKIISDAAKRHPSLQPVVPNITIDAGQQISVITMSNIEIPPVANKR